MRGHYRHAACVTSFDSVERATRATLHAWNSSLALTTQTHAVSYRFAWSGLTISGLHEGACG